MAGGVHRQAGRMRQRLPAKLEESKSGGQGIGGKAGDGGYKRLPLAAPEKE
jgi:hypothetical protein